MQSFLHPFRKKNFQPQTKDFEKVFELLPQASILLDLETDHLYYANNKALVLTAFSRAEFISRKIDEIFSGSAKRDLLSLQFPGDTIDTTLKTRHQNNIPVRITYYPLDESSQMVIITIEPLSIRENIQRQHKLQIDRIQAFNELVIAFNKKELTTSLQNIITASQKLTGAEFIALYTKPEENQQIYQKTVSLALENIFPEKVEILESQSTKTNLWESGKRPQSVLQKIAKSNNFNYIVTVFIENGVLIIGDRKALPSNDIIPLTLNISDSINTIIDLHKELSRLKSNYNNLYIDSILGSTIKDSVQDGVLIISPDLVIMEMNYSASLIFGYAKNEANGQPIENILIGPENLIPSLRKTSESGLGLDLGIVNLYRRNGQAFKAFLRINPILNMQSVEKIIVVITDHSEQEALRVQSEQLEQSAYLGEISAIFAHEVRNPINNISTGLQLMAIQMETDNPLQAQIQRMQRDCARLTHLMDSGLSFSRPMDYNKTRLQLGKLLGKILDRWQPMMQQANIKSQLNIAPETPDAIGNARYLDQVFTNLVSNAIDAMENEGGNLTINIRPTEITSERDKVEVIISDTGPGIPDDVQEMIFKPFYTTRAKGTGLGLAIAKRIITAHKGSLHLSSVPGGTVFRVRLPIYDENASISQGDI